MIYNYLKKLALFSVLFILACTPSAYAEKDAIYTSWQNNLAVQGFDVVSFYSGKPQEGKAEFSTVYKKARWQFSSEANLDLFQTNPNAFIPQYGGYCAWAVANGKLAKGSSKYWHVEDGRLYLNFNSRIQEKWDKDRAEFISLANEKWPEILK